MGTKDNNKSNKKMKKEIREKSFWKKTEEEFGELFDYMWIEPSVENPKMKDHYFKIYNIELLSFLRQKLYERNTSTE